MNAIKTNLSDIIKEELDKNNIIPPSKNNKEPGEQKKTMQDEGDSKLAKNADFEEKSSFEGISKQNIKLRDIIEEELAKKDIITPSKITKKSQINEKKKEPQCCNCGYKGEMKEKLSIGQRIVLFCVIFCVGAGFGISSWWFLGGLFGFIFFGSLMPNEKNKIYVCPQCKTEQVIDKTMMGNPVKTYKKEQHEQKYKNRIIYILLGILFGWMGGHNFYIWRYKSAIAECITSFIIVPILGFNQLFLYSRTTMMGVLLWALLESVFIKKDGSGKPLKWITCSEEEKNYDF